MRVKKIIFLLLLCWQLGVSYGFKWVVAKAGSELPENVKRLTPSRDIYVGRATIYNTIQPVEVFNTSYARVFNTYTETYDRVEKFKIFTATEECDWVYFGLDFLKVPQNVVRVGRAWNAEPIYLGSSKRYNDDNDVAVASILLTSKKIVSHYKDNNYNALACADTTEWVDVKLPDVPDNAIAINQVQFLSRIMGPLSFIPAIMSKKMYYCWADFWGLKIRSEFCQVMIKTPDDEYYWFVPNDFDPISEKAVVVGRNENMEFIYVGRIKTGGALQLLSFSHILSQKTTILKNIEILSKNIFKN